MLREGEAGAGGTEEGTAGGAICICWEVRLEAVLDVRRGDEARGLGDGGTELRSGAIVSTAVLTS